MPRKQPIDEFVVVTAVQRLRAGNAGEQVHDFTKEAISRMALWFVGAENPVAMQPPPSFNRTMHHSHSLELEASQNFPGNFMSNDFSRKANWEGINLARSHFQKAPTWHGMNAMPSHALCMLDESHVLLCCICSPGSDTSQTGISASRTKQGVFRCLRHPPTFHREHVVLVSLHGVGSHTGWRMYNLACFSVCLERLACGCFWWMPASRKYQMKLN